MQREFTSREQLVSYLRQQFPTAAQRDRHVSEKDLGSLVLCKVFVKF